MMLKNGETKCPKCKTSKLWIRRNWENRNGKHIGLKGYVKCENYLCAYECEYVEAEWDIALRVYE